MEQKEYYVRAHYLEEALNTEIIVNGGFVSIHKLLSSLSERDLWNLRIAAEYMSYDQEEIKGYITKYVKAQHLADPDEETMRKIVCGVMSNFIDRGIADPEEDVVEQEVRNMVEIVIKGRDAMSVLCPEPEHEA